MGHFENQNIGVKILPIELKKLCTFMPKKNKRLKIAQYKHMKKEYNN